MFQKYIHSSLLVLGGLCAVLFSMAAVSQQSAQAAPYCPLPREEKVQGYWNGFGCVDYQVDCGDGWHLSACTPDERNAADGQSCTVTCTCTSDYIDPACSGDDPPGGGPPPPPPPPPSEDKPPLGNMDPISCIVIQGWAFDPDDSSDSINVELYRDGYMGSGGVLVGKYLANVSRPDVNSAYGITGNHGFYITPIPAALKDGTTHVVYAYAVGTDYASTRVLLGNSGQPLNCPSTEPPVCPSSNLYSVVVADAMIRVGTETTAFAPNGWTGGSFVSSNSGIAQVTATSGDRGTIRGIASGTATISGANWTASNGATGCALGGAIVTVAAGFAGTLSATNPSICAPVVAGVSTVTASSNVYGDVMVDNAEGIPNNTLFFGLGAFETKSIQTGPWVKDGTVFRLVAPFNGGVELARVTVRAGSDCKPPTVDLKIVNTDNTQTDGPITVSPDAVVPLRWVSANTTACAAEGGWTSKTETSGTEPVRVTQDTLYTIVCRGPGGEAKDSVRINVASGPDIDTWVDNSATIQSGVSVDCDRILVTWTPAAGVTGYRIYYFSPDTNAWALHPEGQVTAASATVYDFGNSDRLGKVITPVSLQAPYRYRVYTYTGNNESVAKKDATGSPIAAVLCGKGVILDRSNKDIIKIRNVALSYNTLVEQDHAVNPAMPVVEGDTVAFAINLVNGGTDPITTPIFVEDVLTNLVQPVNGYNLKVSCEDNGQCRREQVSLNPRSLSLRVVPIGGHSLAANSAEAWTITFTARTQAPDSRRGQPFRFQNTAYVNGSTGPLLKTPPILVLPSGAPTIEEIQ